MKHPSASRGPTSHNFPITNSSLKITSILIPSIINWICLFLFIHLFIYLFIYLLAVLGRCCSTWAFPSCGERGWATLHCGAWASHCGGFSCCKAWSLGMRASVVVAHGLSCSAARGIIPDQGSNLALSVSNFINIEYVFFCVWLLNTVFARFIQVITLVQFIHVCSCIVLHL